MEQRLLKEKGAHQVTDLRLYNDIPKEYIGTFTATMRDVKGQIEISMYRITKLIIFGDEFKTALTIRDDDDLRREFERYWILIQDVKQTIAVLRSGFILWGVNKIPACNV